MFPGVWQALPGFSKFFSMVIQAGVGLYGSTHETRLQCQRTVMRLGIDILLIIKPRVHSIHQLLMFIDSRICRLLSTLINHHIPFLST